MSSASPPHSGAGLPPLSGTAASTLAEPGSKHSKCRRLMREYRVAEFGCSVLMYLFALFFARIEVQQRDIPNIEIRLNLTTSVWARDPTINAEEHTQQVPMTALIGIGLGAPVIINLLLNYVVPKFRKVRVISHDTRDFLLSLLQATSMATLLTQFTKNMTGRFRPCFYDMCGWEYNVIWDGVTNLCTSAAGEKEGRKSFPSGHASFAWSTMLTLTLYLLGRSMLNCENRSESMVRGGRKTLKLFLCFAPSFVAAWVAVTRSIDNWHHYADILAGSIIGAVSACVAYSYNYGSVFSWDTAGVPLQECHYRRKMKLGTEDSSNTTLSRDSRMDPHLRKQSNANHEHVMSIHNRSTQASNGILV